jgi:23S rRNA (cytosine1962-C5)-methyltransferase
MREVVIGRQSAGFVKRGHPWIRRDRFVRGIEACAPGEAVTLVCDGKAVASALADPAADIVARVFHKRAGRTFDPLAALARARERRVALLEDDSTDCFRLIHGEGDFLPGFRAECQGDSLVATTFADCAEPWAEKLTRHAAEMMGLIPVLRRHTQDIRQQSVRVQRLDGRAVEPERACQGRELGVGVEIRPEAGLASGIYVDQRETRRWLHGLCPGKRVLNLFAYTGLFSVSLLCHGAERAVDVDLSAPALALASANALANGVQHQHQAVKASCLDWLEQDTGQYDLIICDPPTSAQGGGGWLGHRDYPRLLKALRKRCAPGALLVACTNTLGRKRFDLRKLLGDEHWELAEGPELGADLPQISGFPEGKPFQLVAARMPSP